MFNFKKNEGVKKSNDLQESAKKVVAKTNERVFEHLTEGGKEPERSLIPVSDTFVGIASDGCFDQANIVAVLVPAASSCWWKKVELGRMLMRDLTFYGRGVYLGEDAQVVWLVQKTNNLSMLHWQQAIERHLREHYGLCGWFIGIDPEEWQVDEEDNGYFTIFRPVTHVEYWHYNVTSEQNAHAHTVFPDFKNEGENNVSN